MPLPYDQDDCERPACSDMAQKLQQMSQAAAQQIKPCPPNSAQIGRGSWTLLHSMAAWYPDKPSSQDQQAMTQFFDAFARFYPCTWCAMDFQQNLKEKPVKTASRKELCTWLCEQHNLVNEKLGKEQFSCDMKSLDERWRKSSSKKCQNTGH